MELKAEQKSLPKIIRIITTSLAFGYSLGACTLIGTISGIIISLIFSIFFLKEDTKPSPLAYFGVLLLLFFAGSTLNPHICMVISAILLLLFEILFFRFENLSEGAEYAGFMLASAFGVTALVTNDYFGIGAEGSTVVEMIKSYVSFGFHPNWRGILYGTIVMVLMITIPRKFKKISKFVCPALIALIVIYVMNIFLIPKGTVSPISFVENEILPGLPFDERMPLSAPAVVLIVGGWQSVEWGKIARSFKSIKGAILFLLEFAVFTLTNPIIGVCLFAIIYILCLILKKHQKNN